MTELLTPEQATAADLAACAETINSIITTICGHEDAFEEATLEHRLIIGLEIHKARSLFGLSAADMTAPARQAKHAKSSTAISDPATASLGFSAWLRKNTPKLKRGTARKYATAFEALGLPPAEATLPKIRAKIKDLRHHNAKAGLPMPSLNALYKAARPAPASNLIAIPEDSPQLRLEDAREAWHDWRSKAEKLISDGVLDDLDHPGLAAMKEFNAWLRDRINARLKAVKA